MYVEKSQQSKIITKWNQTIFFHQKNIDKNNVSLFKILSASLLIIHISAS